LASSFPVTGAVAGTYGSSTQVATFTVNAQGLISSVGVVTITGGAGDMVLASTQTSSGAKTFLSTTTILRSETAVEVISGSATIPNSTNPTIGAPGLISIDSSTASGAMLRFYADQSYQLPAYQSKSFTVTGVTSSGDFGSIWRTPHAITIRNVSVLAIGGTNVVGQLDKCDANGANCVTVDSSDITATAGTTAFDDGSFSAGSVTAGSWIGWHTTSVSGTNTRLSITYDYTVDAAN
jgi:hypothetical protein